MLHFIKGLLVWTAYRAHAPKVTTSLILSAVVLRSASGGGNRSHVSRVRSSIFCSVSVPHEPPESLQRRGFMGSGLRHGTGEACGASEQGGCTKGWFRMGYTTGLAPHRWAGGSRNTRVEFFQQDHLGVLQGQVEPIAHVIIVICVRIYFSTSVRDSRRPRRYSHDHRVVLR